MPHGCDTTAHRAPRTWLCQVEKQSAFPWKSHFSSQRKGCPFPTLPGLAGSCPPRRAGTARCTQPGTRAPLCRVPNPYRRGSPGTTLSPSHSTAGPAPELVTAAVTKSRETGVMPAQSQLLPLPQTTVSAHATATDPSFPHLPARRPPSRTAMPLQAVCATAAQPSARSLPSTEQLQVFFPPFLKYFSMLADQSSSPAPACKG